MLLVKNCLLVLNDLVYCKAALHHFTAALRSWKGKTYSSIVSLYEGPQYVFLLKYGQHYNLYMLLPINCKMRMFEVNI